MHGGNAADVPRDVLCGTPEIDGALGGGKAFSVLLKTLAAEEFSPNRFFERRKGKGL